ncbi:major facilitator superfamily domain-containing protein [Hyaloscypha sp. PMI_1271]|nr:major facilitator superfamily domain-containing protein [Hyaloscypha sp. PMI_1271]
MAANLSDCHIPLTLWTNAEIPKPYFTASVHTVKEGEPDASPFPMGPVVAEQDSPAAAATQLQRKIVYLRGPRLYVLFLAILGCVFLVNVEVSIVSTALVTIGTDFHSFDKTTWVVTAFQVPYAWPMAVALFFFTLFSGACGLSHELNQLIVFRALQGVGASGVLLMCTIIVYEIAPKEALPIYGGLSFSSVALATVIGPVMGGAIETYSSWRWIFFFNVPIGACAFAVILIGMPANFPYATPTLPTPPAASRGRYALTMRASPLSCSLQRLDIFGAALLLAASFLLVTPLLQVSAALNWHSPTTIALLALSVAFWIAFLGWEWYLSRSNWVQEPIFPWRFVHNRVWMGVLLSSFLVGIPMTVLVIQLPQRFEAVDGDSPLEAGVHLLAFSLAVPIGSLCSNLLAASTKQPAIIPISVASAVEIIGSALMTTIPNSGDIPKLFYLYEGITGFSVGFIFSLLLLVTPNSVEERDLAVASGSTIQLRMLGAMLGVAVAGSLVNERLADSLQELVSPSQLNILLGDIAALTTLPPDQQTVIRHIFGGAYSIILKIVVGVASVQLCSVALLWRQPQLKLL